MSGTPMSETLTDHPLTAVQAAINGLANLAVPVLDSSEAVAGDKNKMMLLSELSTAISPAEFDPAEQAYFYEEFFGGVTDGPFDRKWTRSGSTGVNTTFVVAKDGFGIIRLATGAANFRVAHLYTPSEGANAVGIRNVAGLTFKVRVAPVSTIVDGNYHLGLNGDMNSVGFNGIYFERSTGDLYWRLVTSLGNSITVRDLGVGPVADTWQTLEFRVNAAGNSIQAYINSVAVGAPITTTIPTTGMHALLRVVTTDAGNTARAIDIDYVFMKQTGLNR